MTRMTPIAAMFALAVPAQAQDLTAFEQCSVSRFGVGDCSVESARDALFSLYPGYVRDFGDAGLESYAILTVLSLLAEGVSNRLDDGDCVVNDEVAAAAVDIWSSYVPMPEQAPEAVMEKLTMLNGFYSNAISYIEEGIC